jgi:hypothetical protein
MCVSLPEPTHSPWLSEANQSPPPVTVNPAGERRPAAMGVI